MKESEAYKTYYAFATRKVIPKPKIKSAAKVTKSGMKKQHAQGLETLSEIALSQAEQIKIALERSKTQQHSSHASGSGADEGTGEDDDEVSVNDDDDNDDADNQDDEGHEYDEHNDEEQGNNDEQTDSDNDGDDFVHPKFSTHDEEDKEEDSFDPRVQTPSHVESTDNEDSDEEIQGAYVEGDKQDEEETNEETNVQPTQETKDTHVIITAPVNPKGQKQSSSVLLALFLTCSAPVQIHFNQTNQFAAIVSSILGIVDVYLANKMHEAVKTAVELQSERLRDEAQAENTDFINKLDDNIKKIIKDQVKEQVKAQVSKILAKIEKTVNEQLKAEVLTRSSNESKTSHAVAANLSELELKKILIDKMESNKSIHRSDEQKNLYKALIGILQAGGELWKIWSKISKDEDLLKKIKITEDQV
ncbi:hypothetical protein Tco_0802468 [Tanacetum coccineum]|uniref:Uncharacterized protein n=1 Tax=Tanacetum coccineum TaxID=301880 RepID=A0ABQ5A2W2_9ASTR